eukprot:2591091-Prymnesium_polylepis.2
MLPVASTAGCCGSRTFLGAPFEDRHPSGPAAAAEEHVVHDANGCCSVLAPDMPLTESADARPRRADSDLGDALNRGGTRDFRPATWPPQVPPAPARSSPQQQPALKSGTGATASTEL